MPRSLSLIIIGLFLIIFLQPQKATQGPLNLTDAQPIPQTTPAPQKKPVEKTGAAAASTLICKPQSIPLSEMRLIIPCER